MTSPVQARDVHEDGSAGSVRWAPRHMLWPLSATHVLIIAAASAVGWAYVAVSVLDWAPATWLRMDRHVRDAVWVPALIAALSAGFFGRWASPRSAMMSTAAGRGLARVAGAIVRSVAIVVGAVALLAVALLSLALASRGASGDGSVVSTLSHVAGVVASVPLGYALSRVSPSRVWPVVTVAGTALALFLPLLLTDTVLLDTGRSLLSVSLGWGISAPDTGWAVPATIGVLRIGYFALLAVGCTMMAGVVIRRGSARDKLVALAPAALPVGLLATIGLVSPNLHLVIPTPVETICAQPDPDAQVCVASDDRALLGDISATVGTLVSVAPPSQPVLVTLPLETTPIEATIWLPEVAHASTRPEFDQQVARAVAYGLLAPGDCSVLEDKDVPDEYWRGVLSKMLTLVGAAPEQTGVLEASGEPVYGNGYDQLAPLSRDEFADWLRAHIDEVRECSLTPDQLP